MSPPVAKSTELVPGYSLQERIGAGGYGEVWKAEAPGGLAKAVKLVYGYLDDDRAARELKALKRIKEVRHPFLLSLERIEVVEGQLVIVMELADLSVKDRFEQCQKAALPGIPRDELLVYLGDAADALDYMSEQHSLQHLDIKPENLLILGGRVKVGDFGLVKDIQDKTISLLGGLTPVYAPPEVFDGCPSLHSDQYSLAIVYQEMLTGVVPFPGRTASQLAAQHLHSPPRLAPLAPRDQAIIARALSKDPKRRFPSCRAMIDALLGRGGPDRDCGTATPDLHPAELDPQGDTTPLAAQVTEVVARRETGSGRPESGGRKLEAGDPRREAGGAYLQPPGSSPQPPAPSLGPLERVPSPSPKTMAPARELPPIHIEPEACGLRPTLVVGIGGTGACTLRRLRRRLHQRFGGPARVPAVRMLLVDTDGGAVAEAGQGDPADALLPSELLLMPLRRPQDYRAQSQELLAWLSRRWLYNIPRSLHTEGLRPLGRLAFVDHAPKFMERLGEALGAITSESALAESAANTGMRVRSRAPRVFVVSSISGGTGGGMALDVGYAIRKVLRELGLPEEGLCGILTHSSGRNPHQRDLAVANAYAFLGEMEHYGRRGRYPGDAACGLPPFPPNVAAFHDTYLVWLGSDLDAAHFEAAVDGLAEYLYLDAATAGGVFFDRCRHEEHYGTGPPPQDIPLRTFGIWHVGRSLGDVVAGATEALAKNVVRRWRGDADAAPEAGKSRVQSPESRVESPEPKAKGIRRSTLESQLSVLDSGLSTLDSRPSSPQPLPAALQWAEEHQLRAEALVEHAVRAIGSPLGEDPEACLQRLLGRHFADSSSCDGQTGCGVRGEQVLAAIDAVLGPRESSEGPQTDLQYAIHAALEKQLEERGLTRCDALAAWILEQIDSPEAGLGAARRAGEWFAEHLRALEAELRQEQQDVQASAAEMEQSLLSPFGPDPARAKGRFGLTRRPKRTAPPAEQSWLEYCRLRLAWLALPAALRVVRSLQAQVARAADRMKELQRELGLIGDALDDSAFQASPGACQNAPPDTVHRVRERVVHRLRTQMPQLAAELDRRVRAEFLGQHGGLRELLTRNRDLRRSLVAALRHSARGMVMEVLKEIDVTRLLLCPDYGQAPGDGLREYLQGAAPGLSGCGGAKRLLVVLPEGLDDGSVRQVIQQHLAEGPSLVSDPEFDVVLCWEAEQLPLSVVAASLIDCRVDYAQAASRLHTRVDVAWTQLT